MFTTTLIVQVLQICQTHHVCKYHLLEATTEKPKDERRDLPQTNIITPKNLKKEFLDCRDSCWNGLKKR